MVAVRSRGSSGGIEEEQDYNDTTKLMIMNGTTSPRPHPFFATTSS